AADTPHLLTKTRAWFDCYLRHVACDATPARFTLVPDPYRGKVAPSPTLPRTRNTAYRLPGVQTITQAGKAVRTTAKLVRPLEVFGAPSVRLSVTPRSGWSRLVAVLSALTPSRSEIVVGEGGVPLAGTRPRKVVIRLSDQ